MCRVLGQWKGRRWSRWHQWSVGRKSPTVASLSPKSSTWQATTCCTGGKRSTTAIHGYNMWLSPRMSLRTMPLLLLQILSDVDTMRFILVLKQLIYFSTFYLTVPLSSQYKNEWFYLFVMRCDWYLSDSWRTWRTAPSFRWMTPGQAHIIIKCI